jgi:hypothetical protein
MEVETATLEGAPVEAPAVNDDALASFLAEDNEPTEAQPEEAGQSPEGEPAPEGEAQEADEASPDDQPPVDDQKFKVKVRGEELEVPLSELLNGYSRTEDYKAKTAEVANERRQLATEYADKLEQQVQLVLATDPVLAQAQNLDWNALAQSDPAAYVQFQAQYEARVNQLQAAAREIEGIRQANAARQAEEFEAATVRELDRLAQALPNLKSQDEAITFARGVADKLRAEGVSDAALAKMDEANDATLILLAHDAMQWRALQRAKTTAQDKKAAPANQPTLKPRAADSPRAPKKPGPGASDADRQAWIVAQLDAE